MTRTRKLKKEGKKTGRLTKRKDNPISSTKPTSRAYMPGGVTKGDVLLRSLKAYG
jgi:hypothetical protein